MTNFRLIETWTQFSQGWEDAPGSLFSSKETTQKSVWKTWEDQPEEFGEKILEEGIDGLEKDSGQEEFSYRLEQYIGGKWKFIGSVYPKPED